MYIAAATMPQAAGKFRLTLMCNEYLLLRGLFVQVPRRKYQGARR